MGDKPALLIDVDGVLNVPGRAGEPGWETHLILGPGDRRTFEVVINRSHGSDLLDLAEWFELTWATTWWTVANERLGPLLGLPPLPAVPLPSAFRRTHNLYSPKTPHVRRWAKGRPLAWVDDDIGDDDATALTRDWSAHRLEVMRSDPPVSAVLALAVDPNVGLTRDHLARLRRWAITFESSAIP